MRTKRKAGMGGGTRKKRKVSWATRRERDTWRERRVKRGLKPSWEEDRGQKGRRVSKSKAEVPVYGGTHRYLVHYFYLVWFVLTWHLAELA